MIVLWWFFVVIQAILVQTSMQKVIPGSKTTCLVVYSFCVIVKHMVIVQLHHEGTNFLRKFRKRKNSSRLLRFVCTMIRNFVLSLVFFGESVILFLLWYSFVKLQYSTGAVTNLASHSRPTKHRLRGKYRVCDVFI